MNGSRLLLAGVVAGTGVVLAMVAFRGYVTDTPGNTVLPIDASTKTLRVAFPFVVTYTSELLGQSLGSESERRIPVGEADRSAVKWSLQWIKKVINQEWLPEDGLSEESLILVRGEGNCPDVARATWQYHGYQIDVSQIQTNVVIRVVPPEGTNMGSTLPEKVTLVKEICARLFVNQSLRYGPSEVMVPVKDLASKICDYSFRPMNIRELSDGVIGLPLTRHQAGVQYSTNSETADRPDNPLWSQTSGSWGYWWRHVCWWHDGNGVGFFFPKCEVGPFALDHFTFGTLHWLEPESAAADQGQQVLTTEKTEESRTQRDGGDGESQNE